MKQTIFGSLTNARQSRGLTQSQLSQLLKLPQSYISQVEQGKHDTKLSTLLNWARALDLELMLIPRKEVPTISYLIQKNKTGKEQIPAAYGPLPDEVE